MISTNFIFIGNKQNPSYMIEIIKERHMIIIYHPDKYIGELTKEQVQEKMSLINRAYETLSNPEKRQQYDSGNDPNDPNAQQNPFANGFPGGFPFGDFGGFPGGGFPGGGNFHFNFRH